MAVGIAPKDEAEAYAAEDDVVDDVAAAAAAVLSFCGGGSDMGASIVVKKRELVCQCSVDFVSHFRSTVSVGSLESTPESHSPATIQ